MFIGCIKHTIYNIFEKLRFFASQWEMLPFISKEFMFSPEVIQNHLNFTLEFRQPLVLLCNFRLSSALFFPLSLNRCYKEALIKTRDLILTSLTYGLFHAIHAEGLRAVSIEIKQFFQLKSMCRS